MKLVRQIRAARGRHGVLIVAVLCASGLGWGQMFTSYKGMSSVQSMPSNTSIEFLQSFDADGDGQINKQEFLKAHEAMFEIMDASGDGKIDGDEIRTDPARLYSDRARWAADVIQRYDGDDDQVLSAEEAPFRKMAFTRADANKDNRVDRRELTQFGFDLALLSDALRADNPAKAVQVFLKKHDKNADGKIVESEFDWGSDTFGRYDRNRDNVLDAGEIGRIPPLPPSPKMRARGMLKQRDSDKNGQLSVGEYGRPPERFSAADRDANGQLSLDELTRLLAQPYRASYKTKPERRLQVAPGAAARKAVRTEMTKKPPKGGAVPKTKAGRPPVVAPKAPK